MSAVRKAVASDLDAVYELCLEALQRSEYSNIPHNEADSRKLFAGLIVSGDVFVTDDVNGIIIGYLSPLWFNNKLIGANDLIFYVRDCAKSAGVRLAREYKKWALSQTEYVFLSASFGANIERTEQFYRRLGFNRIGGMYILKGD